jgi:hypothetical protein
MIWAFLSRRVRTWLLLAVALPLGGRVLESLGGRVSERSPRTSRALTGTGRRMREPTGARRQQRRR